MKRIFVSIAVWTAVFFFWFVVSRHNHPNLTIDALATTILVGVSAACFTFHDRVLSPRFLSPPRSLHNVAQYVLFLILTIAVLDLLAVLLIQMVYDRLWGPDPHRFGFGTNVLLEAVFIIVHLGIAAAVAAGARSLGKKSQNRL